MSKLCVLFPFFGEFAREGALLSIASQLCAALVGAPAPGGALPGQEQPLLSAGWVALGVLELRQLQAPPPPQKHVNRVVFSVITRNGAAIGYESKTEWIPWGLSAVWSWSRSLTDTQVSCHCLVLGLFVTNSEDFVVPFQDKVALCSWRAWRGGKKKFFSLV